MIKYVMRNPNNNALLNNKQFDTLEQAILYAKNDNCWIDEVKVRADGYFKSTEKVRKVVATQITDRITSIVEEVDPRNYDESIREDKWEHYWTDDCTLVNEMFALVESLMSKDKHDEFSTWCLRATEENIIDYIKETILN